MLLCILFADWTTIRVFAKCLRSDIEYKTVSVGPRTTCGELVASLLSKYRMKHRDPNLFYLTMEVTVRRWSGPPVRSLLVLEECARPAQLALCRPLGDARFALQMRKGGVIRVHDTVLMPGSQYKSLLVSYRTRAEEVVQLMLNCYSRTDTRSFYALHQVCQFPEYSDVQLHPDDRPLEVKSSWPADRRDEFVFVLRRNMSAALSLRKLSQKTSIESSDDRPHLSSRSSSASKSDGHRRSQSLDKQRPRCHSVPTPPPRSRKNISHFQQSLLDSSLADGKLTNCSTVREQKSSAVSTAKIVSHGTNIALLSASSNFYNSQSNAINVPLTRFHQSVVTRNTINYNVHFNRPPEAIPSSDDAAVIDCTFATPRMTQISEEWPRPRRSHSASRLPVDSRLSVATTIALDDSSMVPYERRPRQQKTITWIEKTWTTTGCQTILSCTPKTTEREDVYSKSIREFTPPRERPSRRKQVNFADELQFEELSSATKDEKNSSCVSPPAIPPPPQSDLSSESPSPPPLPAVPPPTPPTGRSPKRVTLNDEILMKPPPTPTMSPPPLTPEQIRVIKPCIKYPKTHQRSLSAPSSPAFRKVTLSTAPLDLHSKGHRKLTNGRPLNHEIPVTRTTSDTSPEELSTCKNELVCEEVSEDEHHRLKHSSDTCERNCKNCFYI
ncbi:Ras-associating (RA) domain [Trinorchestia longiramus]|nr:Ras-associating (RA) domain [Trinorchestia longiramus]